MTRRGKLVLALGVGVYVIAWAVGSRSLYPVAVGFVAAVLVAWLWVRLAAGPMSLRRSPPRREHVEGDEVWLDLEVVAERARLLPAELVVAERVGRLGERVTALERRGGALRGSYAVPGLPRGRYPFEETRGVVQDPFGLARVDVPLPAGGALLVLPRLVEIGALFSDSGAHAHDGRRLVLRRPAGFDLHSVREYEQGESLRKVHWRSTAKRGQLMVKELEDAPRDEVAVVLDADARSVVGVAPDSSFEVQVRAAGSILKAHATRGRRAALVVTSDPRGAQRVHAEADWHRAIELLAAVEPAAGASAASLLADEAGAAARALELAIVTASLPPALVDRLVQRALGRRPVSLVYVDASSFAMRARPTREPALLRLTAAGIPVAVVRKGDDLAAKLGAARAPEAVHA